MSNVGLATHYYGEGEHMSDVSYSDRDSLARQERAAKTKRDELANYMKERQERLAPSAANENTGENDD
jgi:hypothetical protein